jgi:hypothetical protein
MKHEFLSSDINSSFSFLSAFFFKKKNLTGECVNDNTKYDIHKNNINDDKKAQIVQEPEVVLGLIAVGSIDHHIADAS